MSFSTLDCDIRFYFYWIYLSFMKKEPRVRKSEIPQEVMALGERIKELMVDNDISTNELAYRLNLDTANLRRYLSGRQEMKFTMIAKFAKHIGVDPGELFKEPKKKEEKL